jgi:hypothetical protein
MNRALWFVIALTCGACGGSNRLYPVQGKVLYRGEPAVGAVVTFHRSDTGDTAPDQVAQGVVGKDGTFRLLTAGRGEGAAAGAYDVLVEWTAGLPAGPLSARGRGGAGGRKGTDVLKGRYADRARPLLHAEVKRGHNDLPPFELKD